MGALEIKERGTEHTKKGGRYICEEESEFAPWGEIETQGGYTYFVKEGLRATRGGGEHHIKDQETGRKKGKDLSITTTGVRGNQTGRPPWEKPYRTSGNSNKERGSRGKEWKKKQKKKKKKI